jgi:hypothetical protein
MTDPHPGKNSDWLGDEVIKSYSDIIRKFYCSTPAESGVAILDSYFVDLLDRYKRTSRMDNVKRMCTKMRKDGISIENMTKIIVPLNVENVHWKLAVLLVPARTIMIYDSLNIHKTLHHVYQCDLIRWFLRIYAKTFGVVSLLQSYWPCVADRSYALEQQDSSTCGIHMLVAAELNASRPKDVIYHVKINVIMEEKFNITVNMRSETVGIELSARHIDYKRLPVTEIACKHKNSLVGSGSRCMHSYSFGGDSSSGTVSAKIYRSRIKQLLKCKIDDKIVPSSKYHDCTVWDGTNAALKTVKERIEAVASRVVFSQDVLYVLSYVDPREDMDLMLVERILLHKVVELSKIKKIKMRLICRSIERLPENIRCQIGAVRIEDQYPMYTTETGRGFISYYEEDEVTWMSALNDSIYSFIRSFPRGCVDFILYPDWVSYTGDLERGYQSHCDLIILKNPAMLYNVKPIFNMVDAILAAVSVACRGECQTILYRAPDPAKGETDIQSISEERFYLGGTKRSVADSDDISIT